MGVPLHVQSIENENIPYTSSPTAPLVLPAASLGHISNSGGARRSTRGWQPSAAALENIASNVTEVDALFAASESEPSQEGSASDWLFAVGEKRVPRSYEQILSLPQFEKDKWLAACKEESNSHLSIPSISGVLHPSEFTAAAPIRLSWVFTIKPTGEYKARIVMLGQHMREGVHYNNTHAPVPSPTLIRLFFALIAADARDFTQLDIKTAFLTAPLDIELDVILPNGFRRGEERDHVTPDSRRRRALTAIPGCPQGTRVWRQKLMRDLNSLGFFGICPTEPCFLKESVDEDHIFIIVWVDDILVSSPRTDAGILRRRNFVQALQRLYPHGLKVSSDNATLYHCLGLIIERQGPHKIRIHQKPFLEQVLLKTGFEDGRGKPDDVPMSPSVKLTKADCQIREPGDEEHRWYRSALMSLNHAANWTRPDLALLVSRGARYMQAPGQAHVRFLKRGLRYLRGKVDLGLMFDFSQPPLRRGIYGFFDASHADCPDSRKSTIAYVFFYSGCAISWKTKLHSFITTSTNHSELVASAMAAREAKYLWGITAEIGSASRVDMFARRAVSLFSDSMGVVAVSANPVLSSSTKHVEIADFFVRELVERQIVTVSYVRTTYMLADVLTKPLGPSKFFAFIGIILGILRENEDSAGGSEPHRGPRGDSPSNTQHNI